VAGDVCGDAEQRIAAMFFIVMCGPCFVEPEVRFLQQVVGQLPVAGDACQINPHRARGSLIEGPERLLVHQARGLRLRPAAGDGEQRIIHHAAEVHFVNDPMDPEAQSFDGVESAGAGGGSHSPSFLDRTYDTTAESTKPAPIDTARMPMAKSGWATSA